MTEAPRSPDELRELARELVADESVQGELPVPEVEIEPETAEWVRQLIASLGELGIFKLMLYVIGGILLALFLLWLRGRYLDRRARVRPEAKTEARIEVSAQPLADAREIAALGEYANAIHLLLLQTIEELRRQTRFEDRRSWTSREVLERSKLPHAAREEFERIVHAVEEHYFGTAEATAEDFDRCAEHFEAFRRAAGGA